MAEEKTIVSPQWQRPAKRIVEAAPTTGDTVMVALNRPIGVSFVMPDERVVELRGNGHSLRGLDQGVLPVGEYGLTLVRKEDWEYILGKFGTMKIFTNGLCFATKKEADAKQEAESRADLRNGMEPIDPEADPSLMQIEAEPTAKKKRSSRRKA